MKMAELDYYHDLTDAQRQRVDSLTPDELRRIAAFVIDWGEHLDSKGERSMDDNLSCTETLVDLHHTLA